MVDTPGIGEIDLYTELTKDYLLNADIFGFIYIIKSDNAGGVQQDRVMYLAHELYDI